MRVEVCLAAILIVGLLIVSGVPSSGGVGSRSPVPSPVERGSTTSVAAPVSPATSLARSVSAANTLSSLSAHHIPLRYAYLPAYHEGGRVVNGTVRPLYASAPAPIGVADFGTYRLPNGSLAASRLETSSIQGTLTVASASALYVDDDAPDAWGAQLNTVVANVTVLGNSTFSYWTQNVIFYSSYSRQLQFLDNVWNFSSAATLLPSNSILSGAGITVAPTYYFALGPLLTIRPPFTVNLYTNTTVLHNDSVVFFNYTITNGSRVTSGSYDEVVFDSTGPAIRGPATPRPEYRIDGGNLTPTGYLLYDAELVLGGPGGGSTTNFAGISATMELATWNSTAGRFDSVPAAYSYGTDTGETASGVSVWYAPGTLPVAHLVTGPSFLDPLWGTGGISGHLTIQAVVFPSNAFILLYPGPLSSFNDSGAQFTPHLANPSPTTFYLPYGSYSYRVELSNYDPLSGTIANLSQLLSLVLTYNRSDGIYTPLVALNNAQLAAISTRGSGTLSAPYVLENVQSTALGTTFAQLNDFLFPVYPGILIAGTNASVEILDPPSFETYYPGWAQPGLAKMGLPTTNDLQIELYNVSHASVLNATGISGWFFGPFLQGFPLANLMLWNSTDVLVAGNTFLSEGSSVFTYGGTNDTFWGNVFIPTANPSFTFLSPAFDGADPLGTGITVEANGDLVYNNYFAGSLFEPASSPRVDIFTGLPRNFSSAWNVSSAPASTVRVVNNISLAGSIIGGPVEGGNYWWNYGSPQEPYGQLPYTDGGAIGVGGDYLPLTAPLFAVTFDLSGLPASASWGVLLNGSLRAGTGSGSVSFLETAGMYLWTVSTIPGYLSDSTGGLLFVVQSTTVILLYSKIPAPTYQVEFVAEGLAAGGIWTLTLAGTVYWTNTPVVAVNLANGSYPYSASAPDYATPTAGSIQVNGGATSVTLLLVPLDGELVLHVTPPNATVRVNGSALPLAKNGTGTLALPPGDYPLAVTAPGFAENLSVVQIHANRTVTRSVSLQAIPPSSTPNGKSSGPSAALVDALVAGLVILAIALIFSAWWNRRPKGGSKDGAAAAESSASSEPPKGGSK